MRVMPSFWAMRPVRMTCSSELDLDIDTGGEIELHQRVHRLRRRVDDVEEPLVSPNLELLAALLVDVRAPQDREFLDPGRQRDRSADPSAGALGRGDDLAGRLIENSMVERLQAYADALGIHFFCPACAAAPCSTVA